MGIIRKATSLSTLGAVNYKSNKEKARANERKANAIAERAATQADQRERAAIANADKMARAAFIEEHGKSPEQVLREARDAEQVLLQRRFAAQQSAKELAELRAKLEKADRKMKELHATSEKWGQRGSDGRAKHFAKQAEAQRKIASELWDRVQAAEAEAAERSLPPTGAIPEAVVEEAALRDGSIELSDREQGAFIGGDDLASQIARLADLRATGVLSEDEFTAAKARLLH